MNPVITSILATTFLREPLGPQRVAALALGVVAVLAACAKRLMSTNGIDPVIALLVVALLGLSVGGVYQQRYCTGVDFRPMSAVQNAVALIPAAALAALTPVAVHDTAKATVAISGMVLLNATVAVSLDLRPAAGRAGAAGMGGPARGPTLRAWHRLVRAGSRTADAVPPAGPGT
jgi:drug/metabolite transporter (DMT)-like permease